MKAIKKKTSNTSQGRNGRKPAAAIIPPEVIDASASLFPGPLEAHWENDPELPNQQFLVVTVHASGQPRQLVERRREWHRRVSKSLPDANIRLCLTSAIR
ncbi:MAG TPA: hypothetical protein VFI31_17790 [Pirellulales bacterium]|nr:hypothetical protein [Pirellulales bacterium]